LCSASEFILLLLKSRVTEEEEEEDAINQSCCPVPADKQVGEKEDAN